MWAWRPDEPSETNQQHNMHGTRMWYFLKYVDTNMFAYFPQNTVKYRSVFKHISRFMIHILHISIWSQCFFWSRLWKQNFIAQSVPWQCQHCGSAMAGDKLRLSKPGGKNASQNKSVQGFSPKNMGLIPQMWNAMNGPFLPHSGFNVTHS